MNPISRNFIFFCLLMLWSVFLFAQNADKRKAELENKKRELQKEIEKYNKELEATKKSKKISMDELIAINKKIIKRQELIKTINAEIDLVNKQINNNVSEIDTLNKEVKQLKKQYALMIQRAYLVKKNRKGLTYMLSADNINQAFKRREWLEQLSNDRLNKAVEIETKKMLLDSMNKALESKKNEKAMLLVEKEKETNKLSEERELKQDNLVELQKKEKDLRKQIKRKQEEAERLNTAIVNIINEEIRKAKAKANADAVAKKKKEDKASGAKPSVNTEKASETKLSNSELLNLTPEAQKLSSSFVANKNQLPWPVSEGRIAQPFGEHPHPVLKGIKIKNNGLDIATKKSSQVRSVFDGEVTGVISLPGAGKAIIIRHGEFLSVYSNLEESGVEKGEKVKAKQNIGKVMTSAEENNTILHFEIWRGTEIQNPAMWLKD